MREIKVKHGGDFLIAIVDDDDYEELSKYKWRGTYKVGEKPYARTHIWDKISKKRKDLIMHRHIMRVTDPNIKVDHINRNTLDNRKENLRLCSTAENCRNKSTVSRNKTGYRNVSFNKACKKWKVEIKHNNKKVYYGYFDCPIEAAKVADSAMIDLYGEFCGKLNFGDKNGK